MSYPEKYRYRTIEYRQEGHTLEETNEVFKVSITTLRKWEDMFQKEGTLEKKPVVRSFKKSILKNFLLTSRHIQMSISGKLRKSLAAVKQP